MKEEWRKKDNKERVEKAMGERTREEVISPLTKSSRHREEPWWRKIDDGVTN